MISLRTFAPVSYTHLIFPAQYFPVFSPCICRGEDEIQIPRSKDILMQNIAGFKTVFCASVYPCCGAFCRPVSYTHLPKALIQPARWCFPPGRPPAGWLCRGKRRLQAAVWPTAVSYTHLDVYKRQGSARWTMHFCRAKILKSRLSSF